MEEQELKQRLKNLEGLQLLHKTKLEYTKKTISILKQYPELFQTIIESLEITEDEFFKILSGKKEENITFYDQILSLSLNLVAEIQQLQSRNSTQETTPIQKKINKYNQS